MGIDELRGMRECADKKWKPAGAMDFLSSSLLLIPFSPNPPLRTRDFLSFPAPRAVSFPSLDFFGAQKATREKLPSRASFSACEATAVDYLVTLQTPNA